MFASNKKNDIFLKTFDNYLDSVGLYYMKYNSFLDVYDILDRSSSNLHKSYTYKNIKSFIIMTGSLSQ